MVTVDFMPDTSNMVIQLVYRDVNGRAVYSQPVSVAARQTGSVSLRLDTRPRMGPTNASNRSVIIAVISNTDYLYRGEPSRFAKYKYKIKIPAGVTTADVNTAWFNVPNMVIDTSRDGTSSIARNANAKPAIQKAALNVSMDNKTGSMRVNYSIETPGAVSFDLYNTAGAKVKSFPAGHRAAGEHRTDLNLRNTGLPSGAYIVKMRGAQNVVSTSRNTVVFTK
jgi:hypothetical protein